MGLESAALSNQAPLWPPENTRRPLTVCECLCRLMIVSLVDEANNDPKSCPRAVTRSQDEEDASWQGPSSLKRHSVPFPRKRTGPSRRMPHADRNPTLLSTLRARRAGKSIVNFERSQSHDTSVSIPEVHDRCPQIWDATQPVPSHHERVKYVVEQPGVPAFLCIRSCPGTRRSTRHRRRLRGAVNKDAKPPRVFVSPPITRCTEAKSVMSPTRRTATQP